jgi:hypothetical protein
MENPIYRRRSKTTPPNKATHDPTGPEPKTIYEMTSDELRAALVEMVNRTKVYHFTPNDYANEIARRQAQESADRANAIAERSARIASRAIWAAIGSAMAATVSALAAVLALTSSPAQPPPPFPAYGCWADSE